NTNNYFGANPITSVGRGGVVLVPFLDINCNGVRDANEPKADGLNLRVGGGHVEHIKKDTSIRITGLESYNEYLIELDRASFDNVAWQIRKATIKVAVEPNYFKQIEVPISVVGEVSGYVELSENNTKNGLGRIIVELYNQKNKSVAKILTESDGYFSFSGLAPGNYTARIDQSQLNKLKMTVSAEKIPFTIKANIEGDVQDGVEFVLQKKQ
ncbi:MAG TPA: SdrD B-like domain-containing protein, partial [Ferruginibacter sp.]|nr:SdrD B-like domain-containing protein [Ferruginibacter sp.]